MLFYCVRFFFKMEKSLNLIICEGLKFLIFKVFYFVVKFVGSDFI